MRRLLGATILSAAGVAVVAAGSTAAIAGGKAKPNIIVIMADDYGKDAASLYNPITDDPTFPENAPTPALATLVSKGVKFTNGWAMPVCSTTRGTRTLGKLPSSSGMGWVIGNFTPRVGAPGSDFAGIPFPPSMIDPTDPNLLDSG